MNDEAQDNQSIGISQIYLKDCSFESPNTPEIFFSDDKPSFNQSVEISQRELQDDFHEVVLTVTLTAKLGDSTAYIVEVNQAGIFEVKGFSEDDMAPIFRIFCPTQLYPYVREAAASLIAKSGFPPMTLDLFSFEQMFMEQQEQPNAG